MDTPIVPQKRCSKKQNCIHPEQTDDGWLPATTEYFHKKTSGKDGLNSCCKLCNGAKSKKWREENPERVIQLNKLYYIDHAEEEREAARMWRANHPEQRRKQQRDAYYRHPEKTRERMSRRRVKDPDRTHDEDIVYGRRYRNKHPDRVKVSLQRRMARQRNLPDSLTPLEWQACLEWWNGCCAYCSSQQGLWNPITADHYIPVASPDCTGTVASNIIPACRTCNSSKQHQAPELWLAKKFGKRRASAILKRINAYFASLHLD